MILRVPDYFDEFECIAGRCRHSCCAGWEVEIDEKTFDYYKAVPGAFGDRLRQNMSEGEEDSFILINNRCPFLNEKNLCDIYTELGEDTLCETCTDYPRVTFTYGNIMERCLGLSCEEACRLIFAEEKPFRIVEREIPDEPVPEQETQYADDTDEPEVDEDEEDVDTREDWEYIREARDYALALLQNREKPLGARLEEYLVFADRVQECLNWEEPWKIEAVIAEMKTEQKLPEYESDFALNQLEAMRERAGFYEPMEILDEEWPGTLAHLIETLAGEDKTEADYIGLHNEFAEFYHDRYYEWEQILCYFTYRHFMRAVYDYRFLSQAKLAVTSFLMIRDMDVVRYLDNGHRYSVEDRVDVARIYAREMEHSEENLENLAEDFDFEEIFSLEQMREQVRAIR